MGKPFEKDLLMISNTVRWAFTEDISILRNTISALTAYPLFIVGSGGSLSGAHFVAQVHEQVTGKMAKPVSPLEFTYSRTNPAFHAVLFLTAGGENKDIIGAFERAIQSEFAAIGIICAQQGSKISGMAKLYSHIQLFEYKNPAGKDGFLAVNSLLSTCILAARAYGALDPATSLMEEIFELEPGFNSDMWEPIFQRKTIIALGASWAWPALIDLESKFTEAALGNVIVSDIRNFAHGRHNWFDKRGDESALLVLETPQTKKIAQKTLDLLPAQYPGFVLRSSADGPPACLQLYIQVFHLVNEAGKRLNIDPGKPKVPDFGRKIYHIGLSGSAPVKNKGNRFAWIQRKVRVSNESEEAVEKALNEFLKRLADTKFSGIIFDYDGTLCDLADRFLPLREEISVALNNLLLHDIHIGIATGRGGSVQQNLREIIDEKYWGKVFVGNYNGAVVLPLNKDLPGSVELISSALKKADTLLRDDSILKRYTEIETRPTQISVLFLSSSHNQTVLDRILEILSGLNHLKIVQSEHSLDILECHISKINVVEALKTSIESDVKNILIIGDQGQLGGNDFEMLTQPYSLSVNRISTSLNTCWNLAPPGLRGYKAALSIIKAIKIKDKTFRLEIDLLDKEVVK